ncbi:hypothetical protein NM688_g313 [Phlebia brevispora]|uniref:Uncharacterized protein n=1 Tax=Phlebia brevispora TaxID=194682 RepID=A0ACC1TEC5_9APHY|nr:hypothetical protein NM688_g313 [Phlebia brevispora]
MPRRKAASDVDISIRGDELEQHRIQLENNLQHTDLSLHLTSPDVDDVEFPRHNSGPEQFNGFMSFEHPSQDHFDPDEHSPYNAWSYRTADDEEGIDPYTGHTISTAAHHASVLTLSAGLGRGPRRDISVSGAEYDPERPLQGMVDGITSRISAFNIEDTKSKNIPTVDFDPLVVDDSAELVGLAGQRQGRLPQGLRSPSTTSSSSRPATPLSPRPTLTDALSSVAFSPKRPRNEAITRQAAAPARPARHVSRSQTKAATANADDIASAPRTRSKANLPYTTFPQQSLSYATVVEPEVNVQPPTPSNPDDASRPSKAARPTNRDAEAEPNRQRKYAENVPVTQNYRRRPTGRPTVEFAARDIKAAHPRINSLRTPYRDKVHLPDVTGLTSAIESPARAALEYLGYDAQDDAEINARLAATLGIVQAKLANLEAQNGVSRRRVRELELELEQCKQEVARERARVFDREQFITQQRADAKNQRQKLAENARTAQVRVSEAVDSSRYQEVVEEQKALQALVMTLKGHLTRLTSELTDHHRLLEELRNLRDTDVRALKDKSRDVDHLRQEVERLGGEVEVLRGVVEEGLKQRREVREQSTDQSHSSHSDSNAILRPNEDSVEVENPVEMGHSDDDDASSTRSAPSPTPSPHAPYASRRQDHEDRPSDDRISPR